MAYVSKRLPKAVRKYSITELEYCSLAINICTFVHLLKRVDFNTLVDYLALTHIFKSKAEPTTTRIKRLLEVLTLSMPHATIVTISHLVKKVPSLELLHDTEFSMRLV